MVLVNLVPDVTGIGTSLKYSYQFFIVICFLDSIHFLNAKLIYLIEFDNVIFKKLFTPTHSTEKNLTSCPFLLCEV